ncbi:MAG: hypothetical protein MJY77_05650 [Bacteroidaceae bacterium]|nr:hypothetical protein [Bacteroidaceae bacterium]
MEDHQICIAHLLRNLTYTMQAFPDDEWSLDMLDLLRDSVHHRNQGDIGPDIRTEMEQRLDKLLARPPVYTKTDGSDTRTGVVSLTESLLAVCLRLLPMAGVPEQLLGWHLWKKNSCVIVSSRFIRPCTISWSVICNDYF